MILNRLLSKDEEEDKVKQPRMEFSRHCPYLDTIDRCLPPALRLHLWMSSSWSSSSDVLILIFIFGCPHPDVSRGLLDFDFEKLCSVSLSR